MSSFNKKNVLKYYWLAFSLCIAGSAFSQCREMSNKEIQGLIGGAIFDKARCTEIKKEEQTYKEEFALKLNRRVIYKLVVDARKLPEGTQMWIHNLGKDKLPKDMDAADAKEYPEVFYLDYNSNTKKGLHEISLKNPRSNFRVRYEVLNETFPGSVTVLVGFYLLDDLINNQKKKRKR